MRIGIAGTVAQVDCDDPVLERGLHRRYSSYASDREPDFVVELVVTSDLAGSAHGMSGKLCVRIEEKDESTWRIFCDGAFDASFDYRQKRGLVRLRHPRRHFDAFLESLYAVLLGCSDGLLLRAACPVVEDVAVLLLGRNSAGAISLTRQGFSYVLGDELVAVREKRGGGFVAFKTPFGHDVGSRFGANSAPVGGMYLLRRGTQNRVMQSTPSSALLEVLDYTVFFGPSARIPTVIDRVSRLSEEHFVGQFKWTPRSDVASFVRDDLAGRVSGSATA
jgi:hypothetical protein